jgi:hypothetical protein
MEGGSMKMAGRALVVQVPSFSAKDPVSVSWRVFQELLDSNECFRDLYYEAHAFPDSWVPEPLELTPIQWLNSFVGRLPSNKEQLAFRYNLLERSIEVAFAMHVMTRQMLTYTFWELLRCRIRSA